MALIKGRTSNNNRVWNNKLRLKPNEVVTHLGSYYQNMTGINSEPGIDDNWVHLGVSNDNQLVHTTGNEIIEGVKAFLDGLKIDYANGGALTFSDGNTDLSFIFGNENLFGFVNSQTGKGFYTDPIEIEADDVIIATRNWSNLQNILDSGSEALQNGGDDYVVILNLSGDYYRTEFYHTFADGDFANLGLTQSAVDLSGSFLGKLGRFGVNAFGAFINNMKSGYTHYVLFSPDILTKDSLWEFPETSGTAKEFVASTVYVENLKGIFENKTTTELNAIASPIRGKMYYNTTIDTYCFHNGTSWQKLTHTNL